MRGVEDAGSYRLRKKWKVLPQFCTLATLVVVVRVIVILGEDRVVICDDSDEGRC